MLKLYALPLSGYCTKVRIVLRIKAIPFEESLPLGGHYTSEQHQKHMPPGSIPAIEDDNFKLFDSEAIVEYLEDRWPNPSMRAVDPGVRGRQRAVAQFHNSRVEPAVRALFPLIKAGLPNVDGNALRSVKQGFDVALDKLESVIEPHPFIGGNTPCLADCGYPATLRMGQDLFSALGQDIIFSGKVTNWLAALEHHPVIGEEVSNNRKAVADWVSQFK